MKMLENPQIFQSMQNTKEIVQDLRVFKYELVVLNKVNGLPYEFLILTKDSERRFRVMNDLINLGLENKEEYMKWLKQILRLKLKS